MSHRAPSINEGEIVSRGFERAFGAGALGALMRIQRDHAAGLEGETLAYARGLIERRNADRIAGCADPIRRAARRLLGRTPDCPCPAGRTCPRVRDER